jgi:hypothetical protein
MPDSKTITVTYGEYSDSVTIIKVKEGSDAVSTVLSNPTMVFDKADTNAKEVCEVFVYRGAVPIPYGKANQNSGNWYYTLTEINNNVVIDGNGKITVTNPGTTGTISLTLNLYKNSTTPETKVLNIGCTVLSNLKISLTNDSGVVVTDANGNDGAYGPNTTTTAKIYEGSKEVTADWNFSASTTAEGVIYAKPEGSENSFEVTNIGNNDSIVLTITATKGSDTLTTNFIVSKLKQGATGDGAVNCYIESSAGTLFSEDISNTAKTTLKARIFEGATEVDRTGELLNYSWFKNNETTSFDSGK